MDITQRRKEFTVFLIDRDLSSIKPVMDSIQSMGYEDTRFYPTLESALAMAREELPHIVTVDVEAFSDGIEKFLIDLNALSPEILPILIVPSALQLQAFQYVGRGLAYDSIVKPFVSSLEIIQKMDRAASRLYFQFESEQLREHFSGEGAGGQPPLAPVLAEKPSNLIDLTGFNNSLSRFSMNKELEPTVQVFMDSVTRILGSTPVLYFKYVPSHMSLLFSQATLLPTEKFRGIGIDLKREDTTTLAKYLDQPSTLPALRTLVLEVFKKEKFTAFSHRVDGDVVGVFVVLEETDAETDSSRLLALRHMLDIAYKRNLTMKEKHLLDTSDPVTGVYNRKHFLKLLDDEIARARRLLLPVSLIVMDIDGIGKFNQKLGYQPVDSILKTIGQMLKKTTRTNDIVARIGPDEFACLLPHTPHMGAAVKAERIRRIVEMTRIPLLESLSLGNVTMSCGVSEYPSFSSDAESLIRSADESMHEVKRAGGNKVCLASATPGFQLDFSPREMPSSERAEVSSMRSSDGTPGGDGSSGAESRLSGENQ